MQTQIDEDYLYSLEIDRYYTKLEEMIEAKAETEDIIQELEKTLFGRGRPRSNILKDVDNVAGELERKKR